MATGDLKNFKGKVAHVVGYQSYGKQHMRSLPRKVRQTRATKQSGRLFGKASNIAARIRNQLDQHIPNPSDLKMQTRLTAAIYKWLKEDAGKAPVVTNHLPFIEGVQFTDDGYTLADRMRVSLEIVQSDPEHLQIIIPSFIPTQSIIAPPQTDSVELHIHAVNCPMNDRENITGDFTVLNFSYNQQPIDEHSFFLKPLMQPNSLLVTIAALRYLVPKLQGLHVSTAKGFMPTAIVNAMRV